MVKEEEEEVEQEDDEVEGEEEESLEADVLFEVEKVEEV